MTQSKADGAAVAQAPILIADDDAAMRRCLRRALEYDADLRVGWEAANGLEAVRLAERYRPSLILMDAEMPRMDGIEATHCLRSRGGDFRIVVLSTYEEVRPAAVAAGADEFLTKDCGGKALRLAVNRMLGAERVGG